MLFLWLALLTAAGATPTTTTAELAPVPAPAAAAAAWPRPLAERLDGDGPQKCWETLMQIKSCTGEIILFFLDGEAYLGPGCCRAVRAIEQRCWAADAVLSLVGFTPQEGDMLKGYCDAGQGPQQQHGSSSSPPPPPPCRAVDGSDAVAVARESVVGSAAGRKQGPVRGR